MQKTAAHFKNKNMNAKEIMIDDWVFDRDAGVNHQVDSEDFFFGRVVYFEPIPLTPEILEKNGFRLKEEAESYTEYVSGDEHSIITYVFYKESIYDVDTVLNCELGFVGGLNRIHHCHVRYVHQLQQAMRLCGINKTIEL